MLLACGAGQGGSANVIALDPFYSVANNSLPIYGGVR